MRNLLSFGWCCALGALLLPAPAIAQAGKETLGVSAIRPTLALQKAMTAAGKSSSLNRIVEAFDGQLIDRINATRKFEIVGRSDLKDIIVEEVLAGSGNVDALDKKAAQAGKLAGAKYILVTTLDDFEDSTERLELASLKKTMMKRKIRLSTLAKIYDSTTGKLLESANIQTLKKDDRTDAVEVAKNAELTDELLLATVREVAEKVASRMADVIFPAKVLIKRDKQITINRGEGAGVEVGQMWNVFAVGEELIDPDTKESLGKEEVLVGKAKIVSVQPKTSTAEILDDKGIDKGAVLRLPPQPKP